MANTTVPAELVAVNAIQGTLIADNAITSVHIATNAVSGTLVADNGITAVHIATNAVTPLQIQADAVTGAKIADDVIDSEHYADGSIDTAHIANSQVTSAKLADNSVTSAKIVNGTIVAADLADDAVTIAKMAALARGKLIVGDSSGAPAALALGSNGQVLKSDGTDISWGTDSSNDRDGAAVFNESGADVDFRVESNDNTHMLFVDGGTNSVGIGGTPSNGGVSTGGSPTLAIIGSVPELNFVDTGGDDWWIRTSGGLQIGQEGNSRLMFEDGGKVGIGTTTCNKMFNIADPAQGGEALKLHFEASSSSDKWAIYSYDRTNSHYADLSLGQNSIYIKGSDGKVGFGTTSPDSMLHLYKATGSGALEPELKIENNHNTSSVTDGAGRLTFYSDDSNNSGIPDLAWLGQVRFMGDDKDGSAQEFEYAYMLGLARDPGSGSTRKGGLSFYTRNGNSMTESLTVTENKVGIGDTGPSYTLDVNTSGNASAFRIANGTNGQDINCTISNGGTNSGDDTLFDLTTAGGAGDPKVRWSISGNENYEMGIDNSDSDRLKISQGTALGTSDIAVFTGGRMYVGGYGGPTWPGILVAEKDQAGVPMLTVRAVNADAVGAAFHVNSTASGNNSIISCWNNSQNSSTADQQFRVRNDGTCFTNNGNTSSLSDRRLKKNIVDYTYDLSKFKSLRTRKFDWENKELHGNKDDVIGFIAQEVDAVDSRWVMQDQLHAASKDVPLVDADLLTFATPLSETDAMYVSVIQQLITRLEAAEAKITALEG